MAGWWKLESKFGSSWGQSGYWKRNGGDWTPWLTLRLLIWLEVFIHSSIPSKNPSDQYDEPGVHQGVWRQSLPRSDQIPFTYCPRLTSWGYQECKWILDILRGERTILTSSADCHRQLGFENKPKIKISILICFLNNRGIYWGSCCVFRHCAKCFILSHLIYIINLLVIIQNLQKWHPEIKDLVQSELKSKQSDCWPQMLNCYSMQFLMKGERDIRSFILMLISVTPFWVSMAFFHTRLLNYCGL